MSKILCLCRGNRRYYTVGCPDRARHAPADTLDWAGEHGPPPYVERHQVAARMYRDSGDWRHALERLKIDHPPHEVQGTPATIDPRVPGVDWVKFGAVPREPWTAPVIPPAPLPGVDLDDTHHECLPPNAAKVAATATAAGWHVRVVFSIGWRLNANGTLWQAPVWGERFEESGERHRKILYHEPAAPIPVLSVRARDPRRPGEPDSALVALWTGGTITAKGWTGAKFDGGWLASPRRAVAWTTLLPRVQAIT